MTSRYVCGPSYARPRLTSWPKGCPGHRGLSLEVGRQLRARWPNRSRSIAEVGELGVSCGPMVKRATERIGAAESTRRV